MPNLSHRQSKIQQVRKETSRKDFIKEIASRRPLTFYKQQWWISRYPVSDRIWTLIDSVSYETQRDSFEIYGKEFDVTRSFFDQLADLFKIIPHDRCFQMGGGENTWFADVVRGSSDVYLSSFVVYDCSQVSTSMVVRENCSNIFDSVMVFKNCDAVYGSIWVIESYKIFKSRNIRNCSDIRESQNMQWCHHCIWCEGLENASYYINNIWYTKEVYVRKAEEYFTTIHENWRNDTSWKIWKNFGSIDNNNCSFVVTSDWVSNSKYSYNLRNSSKVVFGWWEGWDDSLHDVFIWWAWTCSDLYWVQWCGDSEHIYCCWLSLWSNLYYSFGLQNCSYCLGCIGLKNKSYCILNKQYTKEQWHEKVNIIFSQMESDEILWRYFPASMNPFNFNDTIASLIEDFSKDEIIDEWFLWRDEEVKVDVPEWMNVVSYNNLEEFEWWWTINPDILKKVIQDEEWNMYRIIPMEYKFLKKNWLPLPRKHWLARLKTHFNT